jgi:hypothetical protein
MDTVVLLVNLVAQDTQIDKYQKPEYWQGDGTYEAIAHVGGNQQQ